MMKTLVGIIFLSVFWVSGLIYAEDDDCTRTVTCSDGTKLITTRCSYSYSIIDGQPEGDYPGDDWGHRHHHGDNPNGPNGPDGPNGPNGPDDPGHGHHHGDDPDDPCHWGHGYRVDNDPAVSGAQNVASVSDVPEDPYNLKQGQHRVYDPNDPYGLKEKLHLK